MTDNTSKVFASVPDHSHNVNGNDQDTSEKATRWLPRDDCLLADALVQQKNLGKHKDGAVFGMDTWNLIAEQLKGSELTSGGGPKNVTQCKARWQRLKIEYRTVKHIRSQPGFSWDDKNYLIVASASTWDDYIVKHRDAQAWRKKSFPAYDRVAFLVENEKGSEKADATFLRRWVASAHPARHNESVQQTGTTVFSVSTPIQDPGVQMMPFAVHGAPTAFSVPLGGGPQISESQGSITTNKRKRGASTRQSKRNKGSDLPDTNIAPPNHFESANPFPGSAPPSLGPPNFGGMPMGIVPPPPTINPQSRMVQAIHVLEETGDLPEEDLVKAIQLFRRKPEIVEAYLAISNKRAQKLYLRAEMQEALFELDDQ